MEKRLVVAVLISIGFLLLWGTVAPKLFPQLAQTKPRPATTGVKSTPATSTTSSAGTTPDREPSPSAAVSAATLTAPKTNGQVIRGAREIISTIDTPTYVARFSSRGAQLTSFTLKRYRSRDGQRLVELVKPRVAGSADFPFAVVSSNQAFAREANLGVYAVNESSSGGVRTLRYQLTTSNGALITKTFTFPQEEAFSFAVTLDNARIPYRITIGPGLRALEQNEQDSQFITTGNPIYQQDGSFEEIVREEANPFQIIEPTPEFVGLEDNYFLTVLKPKTGSAGEASFKRIELPVAGKDGKKRREVYAGLNAREGTVAGTAFFGPKEVALLEKYQLDNTVKFGIFGFIARLLLSALKAIFTFTLNWGWAIVVLTAIIKVLLYPLQHKSIVSMKKMQKLQPKMVAIKERYKKAKTDPDQRQKMNMEVMKLYQVEGISPMSGCLPLLLQLPILYAFYNLLSHAIELRGAEFIGWIHDLSMKDPYYITPILMTITMFIQMQITPTTADPIQKKIFMVMPFVMGWIFKEFPSGLVLYWLVQNILTIAQQMIMNKYWKDHPEEIAKA